MLHCNILIFKPSLLYVYYMYRYVYALDVDECTVPKDDCHQFAYCINTKGSYECKCAYGFDGNGTYCTGIG